MLSICLHLHFQEEADDVLVTKVPRHRGMDVNSQVTKNQSIQLMHVKRLKKLMVPQPQQYALLTRQDSLVEMLESKHGHPKQDESW